MRVLRRALCMVLAVAMLAAAAPVTITGQLLAYQDGYVFFTTGDGFRVAEGVQILDDATKQPSKERPRPRLYARATFNDAGEVRELDLSHAPMPVGPLPESAEQFAVAASTPYPNPELAPHPSASANAFTSTAGRTFSGKPVLVIITVQVPPNTAPGSSLYITTDASGWNPQAIPLDRIDALHYRVTRHINSGTIFRYLYTRGSLQTEERGQNGLDRTPREVIINDADVRSVNDVVYAWADQSTNGAQPQPNVFPTPYNPGPFPNLPTGMPTPHPR